MFNFCIDCAYLSDNRVNRKSSNFSSQIRVDLHRASPIPYHMFITLLQTHDDGPLLSAQTPLLLFVCTCSEPEDFIDTLKLAS